MLFKTIVEQSPVSTQVFTPDGKTIMVNKAWENLWNAKIEQLTSYNILQDHQLVATGIMPFIKRGFKGEHVKIPPIYYDPAKTIPIDGLTPRWLSAQMYPIRDISNKLSHIVLQHEDITDIKKAEDERQKFVSLIENSTDFIGIANNKQQAIYINKAGRDLVGIKTIEAVKKTKIMDYFLPKERNRIKQEVLPILLKKGSWNGEVKFKHFKTKKEIPVLWNVFVLRDNLTGEIQNFACVSRDISDRKKYEESIREREERLRIALDAGKIGVWDWNIQKNILTWTENVYKIHDVNKKTFDVTVSNFLRLIYPHDLKQVKKAIEKTLKNGVPLQIDFRIISSNKSHRWVTTSAILMYDDTHKPLRLLGATSDITQQKQIEQDKSDFLSMASHELKTPLTSMRLLAELLRKELKKHPLEKPIYYTTRILDQTDRLTELTNDLLDVSRIETGKLKLHVESFDICYLITDTIESLQPSAKQKIVFKGIKNMLFYADKYRIYQVIVNLVTNAIKYSPSTEKISVFIKDKKDKIIISVKDNGIGIAETKQRKIFDRLYQVTDPKEKTFPGLGLGLYISKEIVERHHGKIWVKSKKGKGSIFSFSLPKIYPS